MFNSIPYLTDHNRKAPMPSPEISIQNVGLLYRQSYNKKKTRCSEMIF